MEGNFFSVKVLMVASREASAKNSSAGIETVGKPGKKDEICQKLLFQESNFLLFSFNERERGRRAKRDFQNHI